MPEELLPDIGAGTSIAGRYTVLEKIGGGGEGDVFLAQEEPNQTLRAVKVIRKDEEKRRARALASAEQLRGIDHPHVVHTTDAGRMADGRVFVVSEWIDGPSLHEYFKERLASPSEICLIGRLIADALSIIHATGAIHRDIKPGNIMLRLKERVPDLASVVLVDFGLLQELKHVNGQGDQSGSMGSVSGTLSYMAPEQLAGRRSSPRTDLYGLGATLYRLLYRHGLSGSGQWIVPLLENFEIKNVYVGPLVKRRLTEEITIPTHDGVPERLRALIERLLRRDPDERITSAVALAREFGEIASHLEQPTGAIRALSPAPFAID
jgi:serine/threonine protein kinase